MMIIAFVALSACVPEDIAKICKQEAVARGFGRCSIEKGRQNDAGVWVVKLDCSRGVANCL